jgi:hypothetical protein
VKPKKSEPQKITKVFIKHVMKEFEKSVLQLAEAAYEQGKTDGVMEWESHQYEHRTPIRTTR